jgi:drug/metabolite transporter (DMT)-like permease
MAALVTLASIPLLAVSRNLTRLLATTETPECLSFWLLAAHVPAGLLLWAVLPIPSLPWLAVAAVAALGLANGVAHWLHSRAFALAPVGALAPYEYTSLLWGGVVGWVAFRELPSRDALLGAAIVAAAGLYNLHREQVRKREEARLGQLAAPEAVAAAAAMVHRGRE